MREKNSDYFAVADAYKEWYDMERERYWVCSENRQDVTIFEQEPPVWLSREGCFLPDGGFLNEW